MDNMIGNRIKTRRKELKLTQIDIKKATGISNGNLSEIENGNSLPSASALIALSRTLQVSIDWILTGEYPKSDIFSTSPLSDFENNFLTALKQLDPDDQDEIFAMINLKIQRKENRRKSLNSNTDQATIIA